MDFSHWPLANNFWSEAVHTLFQFGIVGLFVALIIAARKNTEAMGVPLARARRRRARSLLILMGALIAFMLFLVVVATVDLMAALAPLLEGESVVKADVIRGLAMAFSFLNCAMLFLHGLAGRVFFYEEGFREPQYLIFGTPVLQPWNSLRDYSWCEEGTILRLRLKGFFTTNDYHVLPSERDNLVRLLHEKVPGIELAAGTPAGSGAAP
jgi:hypothetical protein